MSIFLPILDLSGELPCLNAQRYPVRGGIGLGSVSVSEIKVNNKNQEFGENFPSLATVGADTGGIFTGMVKFL
jgi:hypothetical protein